MKRPVNRIDLIKKAEAQLKSRNYDEALGNITQCLDFFPSFSPAKVLLAEVYLKKGKLDFSLKELSSIISDTPDNLRARKLIIEVLVGIGNKDEALSHLNFLEFVLPSDDEDYLRLSTLVKNDLQDVFNTDDEIIYDTSEHLLDDDVTEVFSQSDLLEKLDDADDVLLDNDNEDALLNDDSDEANVVTVTLDSKNLNSDPGIKTMTLASIYEKQGMLAEALEILEKLYVEDQSSKVLSEIKRLRFELGGNAPESLVKLKIEKLNNWLGIVNAVR